MEKVWVGQFGRISGKTALSGAIRYALTRRPGLRRYLDDGTLERRRSVNPLLSARR